MRRILPVAISVASCWLFPAFAQRGGHGGGGHGGGEACAGAAVRGGGGIRGGGFRAVVRYRGGGYRGGYRGNLAVIAALRLPRLLRLPLLLPGFYGGYYDPFLWDPATDGTMRRLRLRLSGYGYRGLRRLPFLYRSESAGIGHFQSNAPQPVIVQPPPAPAAWNAGPTAQAKKYEDPLYLLAMNDGTIRAVLAYWVDGATVHYVTMDHEQKQTPLSSLDRSLSERLNRERNVTFRLPG